MFSVLMSLYYAEKPSYLDACFDSLALQTEKAKEIVLVFDGPIGNELESVVRKWEGSLPLKVVKLQENVGLGKALNIGLEHCSYNLVARMDTDDICSKDRFSTQLECFNNNGNLSICGSNITEIDPVTEVNLGRRLVPATSDMIYDQCRYKNPFNHMTVMFKKQSVVDAGGYLDFPYMEDWYLWMRMLSNGAEAMNVEKDLVMARAGAAMTARRKGIRYCKSEYKMVLKRVELLGLGKIESVGIFVARSVPRLFPNLALVRLYSIMRK